MFSWMAQKRFYLKPSSHISVIKVSPGYTCKRNRADMLLTKFGSPRQTHLMIALTANPSVHNPCNIGRENLHKMLERKKLGKHNTSGFIWIFCLTTKWRLTILESHFINPNKTLKCTTETGSFKCHVDV